MTPRKGRRAWFDRTVPSLRATLSTTTFMQIAKPSMAPRNIPRNPPRHVPASRTDSLSLVNLGNGDIANWARPFGWNVPVSQSSAERERQSARDRGRQRGDEFTAGRQPLVRFDGTGPFQHGLLGTWDGGE